MIRYTVVWEKNARNELTELWLRAIDRRAVSGAANEIDRSHADDAPDQGAEVSEGLRVFFCPPLQVLFIARTEDRIAEVVAVHLM